MGQRRQSHLTVGETEDCLKLTKMILLYLACLLLFVYLLKAGS